MPEPQWEDLTTEPAQSVEQSDSGPFGGVSAVDGLVYADDQSSPELRWSATTKPAPPKPKPFIAPTFDDQGADKPWQPLTKPQRASTLSKAVQNRQVRLVWHICFGLAPLSILVAVVWFVARTYGFA